MKLPKLGEEKPKAHRAVSELSIQCYFEQIRNLFMYLNDKRIVTQGKEPIFVPSSTFDPSIQDMSGSSKGEKLSNTSVKFLADLYKSTGPGCSKLTTSLVNVSLKFLTLISQICQYFLLEKCEKLLHCKSFSLFFNKKFQCIWL